MRRHAAKHPHITTHAAYDGLYTPALAHAVPFAPHYRAVRLDQSLPQGINSRHTVIILLRCGGFRMTPEALQRNNIPDPHRGQNSRKRPPLRKGVRDKRVA